MLSTQKLNLIRLSRTEKIGPITLLKLMTAYNNDVALVLNFLEREKKLLIPEAKTILNEISILESKGGRILTYLDEDYPWILKLTDDFPPVISIIGDLSSEIYKKRRAISIVGSRNCSILAKKFTKYIVDELTNRNFITISGLANGIDEVVHQETINNNSRTVAVLGSGLAHFYPNTNLGNEIISHGGVIISELPFFEKPNPKYFPMRNRIIAGMSVATLVVEAGIKSGSIITANKAAKYGRIVFSVPGFPTDDRSTGTNQLIKDGAVMVRDIDDIINELQNGDFIQQDNIFNTFNNKKIEKSNIEMGEIEKRILEALNSKTETEFNDLIALMPEVNFNSVLIAISELEIKNLIKRNIFGQIVLV
jgi:DNA processing protein